MKNIFFPNAKNICLRIAIIIGFVGFLGASYNNLNGQSSTWKAPKSADVYNNPYTGSTTAAAAGKTLYKQFCAICHGNKGKGDGVAGMALKPRPADFTKDIIQNQSDGAIYWKLTEGKAPMAGYKESLSKEQRWQLVTYIRTLVK